MIMASLMVGQQDGGPVFSRVPPINRDGTIPEAFKDRHVFVNPSTHEIVVSYPNPQNPGERKTIRFGMRNQLDPILTARVTAQPGGLYQYDYALGNGSKARMRLRTWTLAVGSADAQLSATHPLWSISSAASLVSQPLNIRPDTGLTWSGAAAVRLVPGTGA